MMKGYTMARRMMMAFVSTIFVIACIIAGAYLVGYHPGQPDSEVEPLETSMVVQSMPILTA
jgi:hypothetical protein